MSSILSNLRTWARTLESDRGATAVEYGIMVFLIAVAIIVAVTAVGGQLQVVFNAVATALGFAG